MQKLKTNKYLKSTDPHPEHQPEEEDLSVWNKKSKRTMYWEIPNKQMNLTNQTIQINLIICTN